ncbi:hypothetical protein GXP67_10290 [Rhodocytophaga rosea]|uniref:Uncharacterized protein n=1 Tax=Rhodocytophaga rosea TaxID=2704465 RepID=A0A6C0GGC3_9BACT|nr:hypothetical protein [Rhodocytophaga rosea]QHT67007.1 hypothetical protein GXP67_10290 [Rhodocytophaga rosea]
MKLTKKLLIGIPIMLLLLLSAMITDYYNNHKMLDQQYYFDIYLSGFITNYLGIQKEERNALFVGECEHTVSREGLKPNLTKWRLHYSFDSEDNNYMLVSNKPNPPYVPELFTIYNPKHIGYGQNFKIEMSNYTSHPHTFWFEEKIEGSWKKTNDVTIIEEDKVNYIYDYTVFEGRDDTTGFDTMEVDYWLVNNPGLQKATFNGSNIDYLIFGKKLKIGKYRLVARIEKHGEFYSEFEIVKIRPLEWKIKKEDFFNPDSLILTLKNTSGERFYHVSWEREHPVVFTKFRVFTNGNSEESDLDISYDCGTGLSNLPIYSDEEITFDYGSPFTMFMDPPAVDSPGFMDEFRQYYGDSLQIQFYIPTYSVSYFSRYEDQIVVSPPITLHTDELLSKWIEHRKKHGKTNPKFSQLIK